MNGIMQNYLKDTLEALIEQAKEARANFDTQRRTEPDGRSALFEEGRVLAYYEALSTIFGQARTFGISFAELGISDFDPDKELLRK
jgi:hypothetical protein